MKLKKLEILGFKSFLDKAAIHFPPGISAVVGPNGCGKSNIIDALRWVMGEQSVKTLRGKSMEDIIFAGASGKPPLNMAEVALTLVNDNGSVPAELRDYAEIMITRRLYRSGESGYFLNKRPCRLKDIHNLFLGSGLGAKSFAVIQQGNIGAITDAGPDERRHFIEEAAGVTRFKQRRIETARKIEATRQNLYRVMDIVGEIKRQMASLKRQARKAELYKTYQERTRTFDIFIGLHYYDQYSAELTESTTLLQELKDADLNHVSEIKKLDAAVEDIKLQRWQKNQEIAEQKSRKHERQRKLDKTENELQHTRGEIKRLDEEISELQSACDDLEAKNARMVAEIGESENQRQELEQAIQALDLRPLQVVIEVVIAEVRRTGELDVGVGFGVSDVEQGGGEGFTGILPVSPADGAFSLDILRTGRAGLTGRPADHGHLDEQLQFGQVRRVEGLGQVARGVVGHVRIDVVHPDKEAARVVQLLQSPDRRSGGGRRLARSLLNFGFNRGNGAGVLLVAGRPLALGTVDALPPIVEHAARHHAREVCGRHYRR